MKDKAKILLAEDEEILRGTLKAILEEEGLYEVSIVQDATEAIEQLKEQFFNVAIVDIRLPGMSGIQVLRKAKEINQDTIVIIITAYASMENAIEALNEGADAYILKPLNLDEVKLVIKRNLEKQRMILENRKLHEDLKDAYEKLRSSYLATLKTLARILELKDPYLKEHSTQVTKYAVEIARQMGFSEKDLELIENTGFLHDLGKIGVNALTLQKKGKLTEEEMAAIKEHPAVGEGFIDSLLFFNVERTSIRHHHERYDGKGYPDGLAGEEIPIFARILAVADAYDAMTSSRPYRKTLSQQKAIIELKNNAGKQFDPKVVDAFLKVLERKGIR